MNLQIEILLLYELFTLIHSFLCISTVDSEFFPAYYRENTNSHNFLHSLWITVNNSVNIVNNLMFGSISCDVVYA